MNYPAVTHGFVGADLEALTKEAAMNVLEKIPSTNEIGKRRRNSSRNT